MQERTVRAEGRTFSLSCVPFENGCFACVTEGACKLGSLTVSLGGGTGPVTAEVIPAKSESLFARLSAERIAARTRGIAILSVNVQKDITPEAAKEIMREMGEMTP